jgi:hypothetical protein
MIRFPRSHSVGTAGLDYRGIRVRFSAGAGDFFLIRSVETGIGSTPPPFQRSLFPGDKAGPDVKVTTHLHRD